MAEEDKVEEHQDKGIGHRKEQILRLKEYVEHMAYIPVKPMLASERTEELAKMRKRNIIGTNIEHKANTNKKRLDRVGRIIQMHNAITTQQLEHIIQEHRKKQQKTELDKKQQQIVYQETLAKLQKQCEEQVMNEIVNKFAKEVSKLAISQAPRSVETEWYKRLQMSLVCNMFFALKVPNLQQTQDYTIYNKLAAILADFILQALFLAQNTNDTGLCAEKELPQNIWPENTEKDHCIKLRALRAAKKKLYHKRQKCARFGGSVCSKFY